MPVGRHHSLWSIPNMSFSKSDRQSVSRTLSLDFILFVILPVLLVHNEALRGLILCNIFLRIHFFNNFPMLLLVYSQITERGSLFHTIVSMPVILIFHYPFPASRRFPFRRRDPVSPSSSSSLAANSNSNDKYSSLPPPCREQQREKRISSSLFLSRIVLERTV